MNQLDISEDIKSNDISVINQIQIIPEDSMALSFS
jgi:hypothetical protein